MKKLLYILPMMAISMLGCKKNIELEEVLIGMSLDHSQILADGESTVSVSVELSGSASSDRTNVVFSTSIGSFTTSKTKEEVVKAKYQNGKLIATATIKSPFKPGKMVIKAQPEFDSPVREYVLKDSLDVISSVPASIQLDVNTFGIASNFLSQTKVTGVLKNSSSGQVSSNYKVLFEDFLISGISAGGRFRDVFDTTSDSSKVSAIYSSAMYPVGTILQIKATILDKDGNKTAVESAVRLTINQ